VSINRVVLVGRIARDPESRQTNNGMEVVDFTIAVDKRQGKREDEQEPNWFRISAFGKTAEYVTTYLGKGRLVAVDGRLEHRKYQDRDGNNREAISIIADNVQGLDRPREDEGQGKGNSSGKPKSSANADDFDPFLED
jgi:single-strand DNA-binding protein